MRDMPLNCPICRYAGSMFAPWAALGRKQVKCEKCGTQLELDSSVRGIRRRLLYACFLAGALSACAAFIESLVFALSAFAVIQLALLKYVYTQFRWKRVEPPSTINENF